MARKNGVVSLEEAASGIPYPFFRRCLLMAADGVDTEEIRNAMALALRVEDERVDEDAKIFESAAGFAPTVGIIGAVLGLIQVMKHLENLSEVGKGIAVAFVATIYGVGLANLVLLPVAAKIRACGRLEANAHELMLEGVLGIAEGLNPILIRDKLDAFLDAPRPDARPIPAPAPKVAAGGAQ
jgi:chemotaxis protein MotA